MSNISKLREKIEFPLLIQKSIDLYYLTGLTLSKGTLLVSKEEALLFVDGRYFDYAKKSFPGKVCLEREISKYLPAKVGFDSRALLYETYARWKRDFPKTEWVPMPPLLQEMRMIKSPGEIESLKKAAMITKKSIEKAFSELKKGVSEEDLAWVFRESCKDLGARDLSFDPIVAFGPNSAYPHYRAGKEKFFDQKVVLIDAGAIFSGYAADLTRTYLLKGVEPKLERMKEILEEAKKSVESLLAPGVKIRELGKEVMTIFARENVSPLYTHGLGHGVGLEVHEYPSLKDAGEETLKAGMVITIEPGLYEEGLGGVRLEDMWVIEEGGAFSL